MSDLKTRIDIVRDAHAKWNYYPAVKAAVRDLLTGGPKLNVTSIQSIPEGGSSNGLFDFQGITAVTNRHTWERGFVKNDAPIVAHSRVRRQGTETWMSPQQYKAYHSLYPMEDSHPTEYAVAFWLAR